MAAFGTVPTGEREWRIKKDDSDYDDQNHKTLSDDQTRAVQNRRDLERRMQIFFDTRFNGKTAIGPDDFEYTLGRNGFPIPNSRKNSRRSYRSEVAYAHPYLDPNDARYREGDIVVTKIIDESFMELVRAGVAYLGKSNEYSYYSKRLLSEYQESLRRKRTPPRDSLGPIETSVNQLERNLMSTLKDMSTPKCEEASAHTATPSNPIHVITDRNDSVGVNDRPYMDETIMDDSFDRYTERKVVDGCSVNVTHEFEGIKTIRHDQVTITKIVNCMHAPIYVRDARGVTLKYKTAKVTMGGSKDFIHPAGTGVVIQMSTYFSDMRAAEEFIAAMRKSRISVNDKDFSDWLARPEKYNTMNAFKVSFEYWLSADLFTRFQTGVYHFYSDLSISLRDNVRHPKDRDVVSDASVGEIAHLRLMSHELSAVKSIRYVNNDPSAKSLYTRFTDEVLEIKPSSDAPRMAFNAKNIPVEAKEYVEFTTYSNDRLGSIGSKGSELYIKRYTLDHPDLPRFNVYKSEADALSYVEELKSLRKEVEALEARAKEEKAKYRAELEQQAQQREQLKYRHELEMRSIKEEAARALAAKVIEHARLKAALEQSSAEATARMKAAEHEATIRREAIALESVSAKADVERRKLHFAEKTSWIDGLKIAAGVLGAVVTVAAIAKTLLTKSAVGVVARGVVSGIRKVGGFLKRLFF